jgi:hypothetical protein
MAYQTPPTFADGNVLSASQLNILSDNCEFLYSVISGINIPFTGETMTGSGDSRIYTFRRQGRYLHYKFRQTSGDSDEVDIRIDGNIEYTDATNRTSPYTWTGYEDLTLTTSAPAVGDFYEVYVEYDMLGSPGNFHVDYFIESDSTTL